MRNLVTASWGHGIVKKKKKEEAWLHLHGTFCSLAMLTNSVKRLRHARALSSACFQKKEKKRNWHSLPTAEETMQQSLSSLSLLCRPPSRTPGVSLRAGSLAQRSHMSSSRPEKTSSTGASPNKEARCHKQWTINPWSGRKQLGSKSNFAPFFFFVWHLHYQEGGGKGDWWVGGGEGLRMWLHYQQSNNSTPLSCSKQAPVHAFVMGMRIPVSDTAARRGRAQVQDPTCVNGQSDHCFVHRATLKKHTHSYTHTQSHTGVYKLFTERGD